MTRRPPPAAPLLAALALLLPAPGAGQQPSDRPSPPPFHAIRDARIVPVSGPVLDRGTVVIANGVIQAVGRDVAIPPEARVIEGEGLTVYPGLFDALSQAGLKAGKDERGQEFSRGPEDRPATTPWRDAADEVDAGDGRIESWREAGFTTVMSVPSEGIVTGRGAVLSLAGDAREMVVETPVALRVNLTPPRRRGFPSALFGVMAYVEQLFVDAAHYGRARAAYARQPAGRERPRYDRALEPVQQAVEERMPVLIPGNRAREILRAVELGRDVGARTVVYGAQEGWELGGELARAGVPVLVDVSWPERPKDPDPEAEESLGSLRFRASAPSTPAALHRAGVPFAFYSADAKKPGELLAGVRRAVEAGLPADAALRALTLAPAEIYGVSDRLGSIERGKVANLVVTDGDLLDERTKVRMVFVDGRGFRRPASGGARPGGER